MLVKEALEKGLLRAVPLQDKKDWPEPYKNKPVIEYVKLLNKRVAIVNTQGKFWYLHNKEITNRTMTSDTGMSLIYLDEEAPQAKSSKSSFFKTVLTANVLSTNIIGLSEVKDEVLPKRFASLIIDVISGKALTPVEVVSLLSDSRTYNVLKQDDLIRLTTDAELLEIATQATIRGRLFVQEIKDGVKKPLSLKLFKNKDLKKIQSLK